MIKKEAPYPEIINPPKTVAFSYEHTDAPDVELIAIIGDNKLSISLDSEANAQMIKKEAPDLEINIPTVTVADEPMDAPLDVEVIEIIGGKKITISVASEDNNLVIQKEAPDLEIINPPTVSFSDESTYVRAGCGSHIHYWWQTAPDVVDFR